MLSEHFVAEQLVRVEDYIQELAAIPDGELDLVDLRNARFAEHTLQIAIQRCCDVAIHVACDLCNSDDREGMPPKQAVDELAERGLIEQELAAGMQTLISLRNLIVHRSKLPRDTLDHWLFLPPASADADIAQRFVAEAIRSRLGHLRGFVNAIQGRLHNPMVRPGSCATPKALDSQ